MPLLFAPDVDPGLPGAITYGYGLRPTRYGYANWLSSDAMSWATVVNTPEAMFAHNYGTTGRIIVQTSAAKLYELSRTGTGTYTTTHVSKGGAAYTDATYAASTDEISGEDAPQYWCFTSFGAYCLASNKFADTIQVQTTKGGAFADISGSPECSALTTFKNFVIAGNCGDYGSVTGTSDMVAWSALGDHTSWTPSVATQAGYQQLLDIPGRIVALKPIGDAVAVYKANGVWLMRYVGPPNVFSFTLVSNGVGINATYDKPAPIVDIGRAHLIVTRDDIGIFDGSSFRSVADGTLLDWLRRTFYNTTNYGRLKSTSISHDMRTGDVIFWDYYLDPDTSGGSIVYNYKYNKWGTTPYTAPPVCACDANTVMLGGAAAKGINDPGMLIAYGAASIKSIYNVDTTHTYMDMELFPVMGNNGEASTLQRVVPKFKFCNVGTCALGYSSAVYLGGAWTAGTAGTYDSINVRFDLLRGAYWHKLDMYLPTTSHTELIDIDYVYTEGGKKVESQLRPVPR